MISQIMNYCKNHFVRSKERKSTFAIVNDGIEGVFSEKYIVGQYIWIRESIVNDGVYKITNVDLNSKLTLDATLTSEDVESEFITVYGLAVPNAFLDIVTDIESWKTANAGKEGVASESIDDYSISFGTGSNGAMANTWQVAFESRLTAYKQVFETVEMPLKNGVYGYGNFGLL